MTPPNSAPASLRRRLLLVGALVLLLVLLAAGALLLLRPTEGAARIRPAQSTETLFNTEFRHYFTEAAGLTWHTVEAGAAEQVIVLLHGIPGAWVSWSPLMAELAADYRLIAVDLKGLGLTEAPADGSYSAAVVADEVAALLDALDVERFVLVGHEWGSVVASYLAGQHPQRVTHFMRLSTPISPAALAQIETLKSVPQIGEVVLSDGAGFTRRMYTGASSSFLMNNVPGAVLVQPLDEALLARIAAEFSYAGIAKSIVRYYSDTPADIAGELARLAALSPMPVLLVQGAGDPIQPPDYYGDLAGQFANARLLLLEDCGHAPMLEQPAQVAAALRELLGQAG